MTGRVWCFGDNVTTDDVIAGKYKGSSIDPEKLSKHLMEDIRPGFAAAVRPGDFIVAGRNFGCGSSREQAPQIIRYAGIQAVIAVSFARIFYRNAINIGLRLIEADLTALSEGETLTLSDGRLISAERGKAWELSGLDPALDRIIAAGGLLNLVRQHGDLR
jgi:3-isopropylmalate/(R)-2-methylmalate dehydratase small subunit